MANDSAAPVVPWQCTRRYLEMSMTTSAPPRLIVIPRQLEEFFYHRLTSEFAGRDDVHVVVDRRVGERRRPRWVSGAGPFTDRRSGRDRRDDPPAWSLPDMPFASC
jgi:hypothetical protein